MRDRSKLLSYLRGEIVGPGRHEGAPKIVQFEGKVLRGSDGSTRGGLAWHPAPEMPPEEVLYHEGESPFRKYGAGLLHPEVNYTTTPDVQAARAADTVGVDVDTTEDDASGVGPNGGGLDDAVSDEWDTGDDFEVTSPDVRRPSTIGLSFCAYLPAGSTVEVRLPRYRRFPWQAEDDPEFPVNGRYEECKRLVTLEGRGPSERPVWRRLPAVGEDAAVRVPVENLASREPISRLLPLPEGSPMRLTVDMYARELDKFADRYLVTVVLRNRGPEAGASDREATLFQAYFETRVIGGRIERYPESQRPFEQLDPDEQSLALLYKDAATWAIGHGCAAAWDAGPGECPEFLYADVMPAVETPSITPDIADSNGNPISLRMRDLARLPDDGSGAGWDALSLLVVEYERWIVEQRKRLSGLTPGLQDVAEQHLAYCDECLQRIKGGLDLLASDDKVRAAFRLANRAMLLQQIATKQLQRRRLVLSAGRVVPDGTRLTPWDIFEAKQESSKIGRWRAFQIAFLLMQLRGVSDPLSPERELVDLIWFPTGGGKTEAYLAVMAFYMFHQRLLITEDGPSAPARDGTNVLMRYTLRMLTTQQFQRAASLVCAMEFLRRHPERAGNIRIPGGRFALGLWVGGEGTPNSIRDARRVANEYRSKRRQGNPFVLTECPWCRAEIGRYDRPHGHTQLVGIADLGEGGIRLHCSDAGCEFGSERPETWLPVEVIDEQIYAAPPSLIVATADKLAMMAYRPTAGVLFGRRIADDTVVQQWYPPGLIVQDELHLISGPLGTIYGLYEAVFERLCCIENEGTLCRPKIIASTATIRGAAEQTRALYGRMTKQGQKSAVRLFPSPGLDIGDSFFGTFARSEGGKLAPGRLYVGIHASEYGSVLTTQVRAFAAILYQAGRLPPEQRDPWWTLLVFYNSLRELGGAKTLFEGDIRSRLKFLHKREGVQDSDRRRIRSAEELTSRLSQAEIVNMMDLLATPYDPVDNRAPDACLASSIIEVGVDIDRLSLMGVVGQPKTTAQYIQVTGRVGRRWWERPGLILTIYSPGKSRDRSHFEQFHSYHRRLYERVEPTSATPFSTPAIQRALAGALILWARQQVHRDVSDWAAYDPVVREGLEALIERCRVVQSEEDVNRSLEEMERVCRKLLEKWEMRPQKFEEFPPSPDGEYLMLWPGQYATAVQRRRGFMVPSSMRQVDGTAALTITEAYA